MCPQEEIGKTAGLSLKVCKTGQPLQQGGFESGEWYTKLQTPLLLLLPEICRSAENLTGRQK
ncbi:MAG: hypothetical protein NHB32_17215 [Fischerella sp. CENA71]|nr:hypothetical protein [Fischerella sp. CENA71]